MTKDSPGRYSFTNVSEENLATDSDYAEVVIIEGDIVGEDEPTIEIACSKTPANKAKSARATLPIGKNHFPR